MMTSDDASIPTVNFSSLVISLASTAMVELGQTPNPESKETTIDLARARHVIDMLGVLEDKTGGNLDDDEQKLLTSLLAELRSTYIDVSRKQHGDA